MTTMKDVASAAGVSTATVSRVLAGHAAVKPETARRVHDAASSLGYVLNPLARSLRQQRSPVWALVIADIGNPFLTQVARGVEDVARTAGYSVLLCNTDEDPEKEDGYIAIADQYRVAGLLITPTSTRAAVDGLLARGVPVVAMDRPLGSSASDTVLIDSRRAAREAVTGLVDAGRRRVACITGPRRVFTAEERVLGYREALQDSGVEVDEDLVHYAGFNEAGGRAAAQALLDAGPVDGVLVANSLMAVGVLGVVRERGLRAPEDVEIVAFDDAPWTSLLAPSVRVIHQPAYALGRSAAELLLDRLEQPGREARTVMLTATLDPTPTPASTPASSKDPTTT
ncbi:LacI family DNA-binding transcriptional regulator [Oryzobacter terrae]|uniref:LacI family DNA-binding transcriptional regulator n=1 Tax=Oryzobacter terrae TaxID=1620385 RepID=UPI003672B52D